MLASVTDWIAPRKPIIRAIGLGNVTFVAALAAAYLAVPPLVLPGGPAERLGFALSLLAAPGAVVLAMVMSCMRLFDTPGAEENPLAGNESRGWKINQRVLQNTVEQAWIFVPGFLALAARLDPSRLAVLPVVVGLWCTGRILFWIGYRIRFRFRAIGFEWTLNTSLLTYGLLAASLFGS